jgi:hypothetical protein
MTGTFTVPFPILAALFAKEAQPSAPSSDLELSVTTVVTTTTPDTAPLSSQWRHARYQFGLRKYRMLAPTTVVIWLASTSRESAVQRDQ